MKNIQDEVQKIHNQYGVTEMANYKIQLLCEQYANDYHEQQVKNLSLSAVSNCANCRKEYERGIEDGKTIAEHGTTMWID